MTYQVVVGDCRQTLASLPDGIAHCAVTSPPYYGLRSYLEVEPLVWASGWRGHWGLEPTFEMWIENCLEIFRAVRRVLRDDGTLWLNVGQSWAGQRSFTGSPAGTDGVFGRRAKRLEDPGVRYERSQGIPGGPIGAREDARVGRVEGFKNKDLIQQGPLLFEALRRDGWYLRQVNVWKKDSVMPESVVDRPAVCHEYVALLSKTEDYFYDHAAVRQPYAEKTKPQRGTRYGGQSTKDRADGSQDASETKRRVIASMEARGGRNLRTYWEGESFADWIHASIMELQDQDEAAELLRDIQEMLKEAEERQLGEESVWTINPQQFPGKHTAIFPEKLVETCLLAGTSAKGACGACGAQWKRVETAVSIERAGEVKLNGRDGLTAEDGMERAGMSHFKLDEAIKANPPKTVGWESGCSCGAPVVSPLVIDPCGGSGTVSVVAERLGRDSICMELSPVYAAQAEARIADPEWAKKERRRLRAERAAERAKASVGGVS